MYPPGNGFRNTRQRKYHPREKGYELIVDGAQIKGGYRFVGI